MSVTNVPGQTDGELQAATSSDSPPHPCLLRCSGRVPRGWGNYCGPGNYSGRGGVYAWGLEQVLTITLATTHC